MSYVYTKNKLELIDGSLRPTSTIPDDMVLILERAFSGPTDSAYQVKDLSEARFLYGDRSPLVNLASRTLLGGAKNIVLYRIGGQAAQIDNLFGPSSSIYLTEASKASLEGLKVYIGPEPKNENRHAVIVYKGKKIIYSNVIGGEISSSLVQVVGFKKQENEIRLGTLKNPVPFADIIKNLGKVATSTGTVESILAGSSEAAILGLTVSKIAGFDPAEDDVKTITLKDALGANVNFTLSDDNSYIFVSETSDGLNPVLADDVLTVSFIKKLSAQDIEDQEIQYIEPKDSMDASYNELYEAMDRALENLELLPTKVVIAGDLFGTPNVADGSTAKNKLEYLYKGEDENGEVTYEWSPNKFIYQKEGSPSETTTDVSQAELNANNEPVVLKEYGEVDFTHRLGMFAYDRLDEGDFVNVVVGTVGPEFFSPKHINDWIGKEPVRDLRGTITENGSGLLGHRLMAGTTKYRGGFFATANGFVDGDVIADRTGFNVDLGKHLSIVVSQVSEISRPVIVTSAAAAYAGLVSTLQPGESTTNKVIDNMVQNFAIKESKRRALSKTGYVVLYEKPKGLTVYSGDVATRENSDYDYISTAVTISAVSRLIRDTVEPFIGQGSDFVVVTALNTAITSALGDAQRQGWMTSYNFAIRRDGPNSLLVPFVIEAKDELRAVTSTVRLQRNENG